MDNSDYKYKKRNFFPGLLAFLLIVGMAVSACEAPAGPEGAQGPEGPAGPIGPAGEDGSVMYADAGVPSDEVGDIGDYYLNQNTGELYGSKSSGGWGNPIIVLMGEDGQDGANGQDGDDGSQIYSGNGAPDASLGVLGDYYLDKDSYGLYGPKTGNGWGTPLNLKGADGNANVTRYIFPGHDFSSSDFHRVLIPGLTENEMRNSAWIVYFLRDVGNTTIYYTIPGKGASRNYSLRRNYYNGYILFDISRESTDSGAQYDNIEIIRIEAGNTEDHTKQIGGESIIPESLDVSDYTAVAEYYGFAGE